MINFFKTLYIYFFPGIMIQYIFSLIEFSLKKGNLEINYYTLMEILSPILIDLFCIAIPAYLTCITIYYSIKNKSYPSLKHNVLIYLSAFFSNIPTYIFNLMSIPKDAPPDLDCSITFLLTFFAQVLILTALTLSVYSIIYIYKRMARLLLNYKRG
ncbi:MULTISPECIES: hypothetical protein [unclassified Clostridium]|uniref:hypothetical protein n=3 Tax=Clostridium TaxID=1485 RepID=UPI001E16BE64|nr:MULTISPECIES: hypothetical protein [unclassified Clostridium]MBN1047030.1 hypothetical protein [Clostridium botulinum]